nr:AMP-binding protein [Williamsia sterculiae]
MSTLYAIAAVRWPDRVAVLDDDGELTYDELYRHAMALAVDVRHRNGRRPSTMAVLCRNHRGFVIGVCAAAMTGAEVISVNTELPSRQLAALIVRHRPEVLVLDEDFLLEVDAYRGVLVSVDSLSTPGVPSGVARDTVSRRAGRITLLTSGTSGLAKGVPRTITAWGVAQLAGTGAARVGLRHDDIIEVAPPFFHGFGLLAVLGAAAVGATVVCHRRFDSATVLDDLVRHRVSVLVAVPVMVQRVLADPGVAAAADRHHLRIAVTGAAPITNTTVREFQRRFGPILINGYGSTEAGLVSVSSMDELVETPDTVGTPALGVTIRIVDDADHAVPIGRSGRIVVRGPLKYSGYTPDATTPALTDKAVVDGFVDTGDVGYLDARGRLFLCGRSDDMIVSGGENVFPGEVEDALSTHPAIAEAVVVGVDDREFGQVLHAFVVHRPGEPVGTEELTQHLRRRLERYKVPKRFEVVDEIPRNAGGKVLRHQLIGDASLSNTKASNSE